MSCPQGAMPNSAKSVVLRSCTHPLAEAAVACRIGGVRPGHLEHGLDRRLAQGELLPIVVEATFGPSQRRAEIVLERTAPTRLVHDLQRAAGRWIREDGNHVHAEQLQNVVIDDRDLLCRFQRADRYFGQLQIIAQFRVRRVGNRRDHRATQIDRQAVGLLVVQCGNDSFS